MPTLSVSLANAMRHGILLVYAAHALTSARCPDDSNVILDPFITVEGSLLAAEGN
jgi:hypothetical protein